MPDTLIKSFSLDHHQFPELRSHSALINHSQIGQKSITGNPTQHAKSVFTSVLRQSTVQWIDHYGFPNEVCKSSVVLTARVAFHALLLLLPSKLRKTLMETLMEESNADVNRA